MATKMTLRNPETGLTATSYSGFSWTTLFFGGFPALFRGDFITFLIVSAILAVFCFLPFGLLLAFVFMFSWAFFYNGYQARSLISKGYMTEEANAKKQADQAESESKRQTEADRRQTDLADAIARGVALAIAQRDGAA